MQKQSCLLKLITVLIIAVSSAATATPTDITINTLHEAGTTLRAQSLEYWIGDDRYNKFILNCASDACGTWQLPTEIVGEKVISVVALVEKPQDPACSEWYVGEFKSNQLIASDNHIHVRLKHTETACK